MNLHLYARIYLRQNEIPCIYYTLNIINTHLQRHFIIFNQQENIFLDMIDSDFITKKNSNRGERI